MRCFFTVATTPRFLRRSTLRPGYSIRLAGSIPEALSGNWPILPRFPGSGGRLLAIQAL